MYSCKNQKKLPTFPSTSEPAHVPTNCTIMPNTVNIPNVENTPSIASLHDMELHQQNSVAPFVTSASQSVFRSENVPEQGKKRKRHSTKKNTHMESSQNSTQKSKKQKTTCKPIRVALLLSKSRLLNLYGDVIAGCWEKVKN